MDRTTQRGRFRRIFRAVARIRIGTAQLLGHKLVGGAGHCSLDL